MQPECFLTEWDPTATSDLDALRSVFDTNGDGKLTSADAGWGSFKVLVTKAEEETSLLIALFSPTSICFLSQSILGT